MSYSSVANGNSYFKHIIFIITFAGNWLCHLRQSSTLFNAVLPLPLSEAYCATYKKIVHHKLTFIQVNIYHKENDDKHGQS